MTLLADSDAFGRSMSAAEFRSNLGEAMDLVQREPVVITNRGRARAVLVSPEFYERAIEALEDVADIEAAAAARSEGGSTVSHEELLRDLGLEA